MGDSSSRELAVGDRAEIQALLIAAGGQLESETEDDDTATTPPMCPTCGSPKPEMHPAPGPDDSEVEFCGDAWHGSAAIGGRCG